jgi:carbon monoxide dehydrogenase subunit G
MKLENEFTVPAPIDEAWAVLLDVERVAPCLPGATIEGKEGDDYAGRMKVKVGPINATYAGKMRFLELDQEARRAVMRARADEVNGQGNAEARITTEVEGSGEESVIRMDTDLQMRGKVAQFGRGAMEKISQRMFQEFAKNIEQQFSGNGGAPVAEEAAEPPAEPEGGSEAPARAREAAPAAQEDDDGAAMDVFGMIGLPDLGKVAPYAGTAVVALAYGYLLGRLRESRRTIDKLARML